MWEEEGEVVTNRFARRISRKRGKRTLRDVAPEIGIAHATLARVESGRMPDLLTFSRLVQWLDVDYQKALRELELDIRIPVDPGNALSTSAA